MEQLKIQMNEIESMTFKIPTEFTAYSFNKFYEQLLKIGKSMPDIQLRGPNISQTPERFMMSNWQDEAECLEILKIWTNNGKPAAIKWIKKNKDMDLTKIEASRLSGLIATLRSKYKNKI